MFFYRKKNNSGGSINCNVTQSRTGGVLGVMPSATVMSAAGFFSGGGQIQVCKKVDDFL